MDATPLKIFLLIEVVIWDVDHKRFQYTKQCRLWNDKIISGSDKALSFRW
jgi:hypothetical protein